MTEGDNNDKDKSQKNRCQNHIVIPSYIGGMAGSQMVHQWSVTVCGERAGCPKLCVSLTFSSPTVLGETTKHTKILS